MRVESVEPGQAEIDLIVLCRDGGPPPVHVVGGIQAQHAVKLAIHLVDGRPRPGDAGRMDTITRARNRGSRLGSAPWLMFLDDDVELGPGCVAMLLEELRRRPGYAAMAADYLGELGDRSNLGLRRPSGGLPATPHVGMGAALFRREVLAHLSFRWEPGRCECECCCDDLRRAGFGIAYLPGALATHRRARDSGGRHVCLDPPADHRAHQAESLPTATRGPRILTAFDRRHLGLFRHQFLATLRESGNDEVVTAVAYGLWPSEQNALEAIPGLEPVFLDDAGVSPAIRRLCDLQRIIAGWPGDTPVAHWDAGDIIFQGSLRPLWKLVEDHPDRILVVREPAGYPENPAVADWTLSIHDPEARRFAAGLLFTRPFLNAGFVAGTGRAVLTYLREADHLLHSPALRGTTDWGDQMALNLYCHGGPERWSEVPEGWNYCVNQRDAREFRLGRDGRFVSARGEPIAVVHGNAQSLKGLSFGRLVASPVRMAAPGSLVTRRTLA
jgi:hypothetical protein